MKTINQMIDNISLYHKLNISFPNSKKINHAGHFILGVLTFFFPLTQRLIMGSDQTVGYLDPNIWLLVQLSMISFLLLTGLAWWLFQRFWAVIGLPGIDTMVLQFKNLELWQQFAFYWLSFALLLLTATLCLIGIC